MSWFYFAFAAGLASAINVGTSRFLVGRHPSPVLVGGVVHLWGGCLCLLLFFWVKPILTLTPAVAFGLLTMGAIYTLGNALYFKALAATQLSEIDLLLKTSSLWTFVGGVALLGEPSSLNMVLGACLVSASVFSLAQRRSSRSGSLGFNRPQRLALGAALAFGAGNVVDKLLSPYFDPASYTALNLFFTGLGMLALARAKPRDLAARVFWRPAAWVVALTFAVTQLFIILAFQAGGSAGQVILVAQVRLVVLVALGIFFLGERDRLGRKVLAVFLMLLGVYTLYG